MERSKYNPIDILKFIHTFTEWHGFSPTIREIATEFRIPSTANVNYHLKKLERRGYVKRLAKGAARALHITGGGKVKLAAAGVPMDSGTIDDIEESVFTENALLRDEIHKLQREVNGLRKAQPKPLPKVKSRVRPHQPDDQMAQLRAEYDRVQKHNADLTVENRALRLRIKQLKTANDIEQLLDDCRWLLRMFYDEQPGAFLDLCDLRDIDADAILEREVES